MKVNRLPKKKKKNDRTWAEAATLAIEQSAGKVLGIRPILQAIYLKKLKEITMTEEDLTLFQKGKKVAAENVLTTMLNHHAQLPNCPFFKVKGRYGLYALKDSWLKRNRTIGANIADSTGDSDGVYNDDNMPRCKIATSKQNHAFAVQGKGFHISHNNMSAAALKIKRKSAVDAGGCAKLEKSPLRRQPMATTAGKGGSYSRRFGATRSLQRSRIAAFQPTAAAAAAASTRFPREKKRMPNVDLETPGSILVSANMRTLVNRDTFSLLPPSYRYKLTQLLPECDRVPAGGVAEPQCEEAATKVMTPSETALTNEFFTQAVQEWRERLTDGEFTREAQSRIAQEIAKQKSKIDPWKEKFFEEFYGQKQLPAKRLRSRSQNLVAESGYSLRDLGMEAQLSKFDHLRPELHENLGTTSPNRFNHHRAHHRRRSAYEDEDPDFHVSGWSTPKHRKVAAASSSPGAAAVSPLAAHRKSMGGAGHRVKRNFYKLNNRHASAKHRNTSVGKLFGAKTPIRGRVRTFAGAAPRAQPAPALPAPGAVVLRPSGVYARHHRSNLRLERDHARQEDGADDVLHIRRRSESGSNVIADHSYVATWWNRPSKEESSSYNCAKALRGCDQNSTLILRPNGNLVNSTLAQLKNDTQLKGRRNSTGSSPYTERAAAASSSQNERMLSLRARPLTPDLLLHFRPSSAHKQRVAIPLIAEPTTCAATSTAIACPPCSDCSSTTSLPRSNRASTCLARSDGVGANVAGSNGATNCRGRFGGATAVLARSDGVINSIARSDGATTSCLGRSDGARTTCPARSDSAGTTSPARSDGVSPTCLAHSDNVSTACLARSDGASTTCPTCSGGASTYSARSHGTNASLSCVEGATTCLARTDGANSNLACLDRPKICDYLACTNGDIRDMVYCAKSSTATAPAQRKAILVTGSPLCSLSNASPLCKLNHVTSLNQSSIPPVHCTTTFASLALDRSKAPSTLVTVNSSIGQSLQARTLLMSCRPATTTATMSNCVPSRVVVSLASSPATTMQKLVAANPAMRDGHGVFPGVHHMSPGVLAFGLDPATVNTSTLGAHDIMSDAHNITSGASTISAGPHTIPSAAHIITSGAHTVTSGTHTITFDSHSVMSGARTITAGTHTITAGAHTIASGAHHTTAGAYMITPDVHTIASGAHTIASGAHTIASGAHTIASGAHTITSDSCNITSGTRAIMSSVQIIPSGIHSIPSDKHTIISCTHTNTSGVHTSASAAHTTTIVTLPVVCSPHYVASGGSHHILPGVAHSVATGTLTATSDAWPSGAHLTTITGIQPGGLQPIVPDHAPDSSHPCSSPPLHHPNSLPVSTMAVTSSTSPLAPGRFVCTGTKRPPAHSPSSSSPPMRWGGAGASPTGAGGSPIKKTRTLAEIKAQMKARKQAAASNIR